MVVVGWVAGWPADSSASTDAVGVAPGLQSMGQILVTIWAKYAIPHSNLIQFVHYGGALVKVAMQQ